MGKDRKNGIRIGVVSAPPPERGALGLYLHIPFCRSKCDYCDFYSLSGAQEKMEPYHRALLRHLEETAPRAKGWKVDTVYFGGGTPSFFGAKRLSELLKTVKRRFDLDRKAEITLEANPDSLDPKSLKILRKAGFNRVSVGMQSADEEELRCVHRAHTFEQTKRAVADIRRAGFQNLNLDLIYGLPGQDMESWKRTLGEALALTPEHISCYGLKLEPGTRLYERRETETLPDDDQQADLYLYTVEALAHAGYAQYEISNFSKPGFASRHNLKYWTGSPFIGFGPAAYSDFGDCRYSFVRDLDAYIDGILKGDKIVDECETLSRRDRASEYLMLRLRTVAGISEQEYRKGFGMNFKPMEELLEQFRAGGWAVRTGGRWHFTPKGFLVSNRLIGALLERQTELTLDQVLPGCRTARTEEEAP